ncbi:MAG TPA: DoxX family protein [Gemmatimonadaceae bacterium]|nr:DoxX family protein [Gemmatimonadaceae bacterium]
MRFFHNPSLARFTWALLRITAGLAFTVHGAQKVFGMFGGVDGKGMTPPLMSLFGFAGVLELAGGLLMVIGLFSRPVAFILAGEMAAAFFMGHVTAQGGFNINPVLNRGEPAYLYCFIWLFFAFNGAGPFSIDWNRERRLTDGTPR